MFISHNPTTEKLIFEKEFDSDFHIDQSIDRLQKGFVNNKQLDIDSRSAKVLVLASLLAKHSAVFAKWITLEIGKPYAQSEAEIKKCIDLCHHYATHASEYLKPQKIHSELVTSTIVYQPLGVILGVMPWNFPFWQVFRFAIPTIIAGNTVVLKHAPNVGLCAGLLEQLFVSAGMKESYQNVFASEEQCANILANKKVKAVSLTGSCGAGKAVAAIAGANLKPQLLELGGSDVFIVAKDCAIDQVVAAAIQSRIQNNGQSCIAAKRFLVDKEVIAVFKQKLLVECQKVTIGNPLDEKVAIGPLARLDLKQEFDKQITKGIQEGATVLYETKQKQTKGYFVDFSVLEVTSENTVLMQEEIFGPCLVLCAVRSVDEAIRIANDSSFGLSASVWTQDARVKQKCQQEIEAGAVFVNQFSKSDARFPFGGIKDSGYGRELGEAGIKSFVNQKLLIE